MPVDMSAVHPMIQAFLAAKELGQQRTLHQADKAQEMQMQEKLFKQQQDLASAEHDYRLSEITQSQAEQAKQHKANMYLQLLTAAGSGNLPMTQSFQAPQPGQVPGLPAQTQTIAPPTQQVNIPGYDALNIPSPYYNSQEQVTKEMATRMGAIKGAETQAELPKTAMVVGGRLAGVQAQQDAALQRIRENNQRITDEGKLNRQNLSSIAAGHDAARLAAAQFGARSNQTNSLVQRIVTSHDTNPITKNYVAANEAVQFVKSMPNNSTNPADDQGLIYAFAKAMDPSSAVREGEYKTVQNYSQNWEQKLGINLSRVLDNGQLLTQDAREKLKATILQKAQATGRMYQDYRKTVESRIERIAPGQGSAALGEYLGAGTTPADGIPKTLVKDGYNYIYDPVRKGYQKAGKVGAP